MAKVNSLGSWLYKIDLCNLSLIFMLELNNVNIRTYIKFRNLLNFSSAQKCKLITIDISHSAFNLAYRLPVLALCDHQHKKSC